MSRMITLPVLVFTSFLGSAVFVMAGDLTVAVKGVKDSVGFIGCALYNKEEGFGKRSAAVAVTGDKANAAGNTCVFKGLAAGQYAVAVLHDVNSNQKMDYSVLGFPAEDWGMSNNVRPTLRAPTFKESSFPVGDAPVQISITLGR